MTKIKDLINFILTFSKLNQFKTYYMALINISLKEKTYLVKSFFVRRTRRVNVILFTDQTTNTRFFFSLATMFFGVYLITTDINLLLLNEYRLMVQTVNKNLWGFCFVISGVCSFYAVIENKVNWFLLVVEGMCGALLWCGSTYFILRHQHTVGAQLIAAIVAVWLYIRYPTHHKKVFYDEHGCALNPISNNDLIVTDVEDVFEEKDL